MAKLIGLFARKAGTTREDFRDYYEHHHAPLALSLYGHLIATYTRNYVDPSIEGGEPAPYDVVTEIVFHDSAAMAEMFTMTDEDPRLRERIAADEERFMERGSTRVVLCSDHASSARPTPAAPQTPKTTATVRGTELR